MNTLKFIFFLKVKKRNGQRYFAPRNRFILEEIYRGEAKQTIQTKMEQTDEESKKIAQERNNYYDKWHKLTKEEVEKVKEDTVKEKEVADEALGLNKGPNSKAEEEDIEKRKLLKEAKKKWEDKELSDAQKKFAIENLEDVERVFDSQKLHWKPVIVFKSNKRCKLKIPHSVKHKLVKVFVENCVDCEIDFEESTITQHLEITRSKNCIFRIKKETATVQLDLCSDCTVFYWPGMFKGDKVRMFHAGVKNLTVKTEEGETHKFSYEKSTTDDDDRKKEIQFVTHRKDGKIVTERVIRDKGNLPATQDEMVEKELSAQTLVRDAELKKIGGNEAFAEKHYAQAAVFYTESIDMLGTAKKKKQLTEEEDFTYSLLSNRAFCWQKLGHHEKAAEDARLCIKMKPDFCKAHFRLGLSLHAQKKYFEAVPVLGEALKLEPKNEQIKQALGFAEMAMRKMMRHDDD